MRLGVAARRSNKHASYSLNSRHAVLRLLRFVDTAASGHIRHFILLLLVLATISLPASTAVAAAKVGVAAAVNPSVTGMAPGAAPHVIQVGVDMQADERVVTTTTGQTQLLFLDGSALTIGPSSEVTIDKFVFDPGSGSGTLVMSAAKGVFRLVGGKISKGTPVEFKTPSATIGVRGGIAVVTVAPGRPLMAQFLYGHEMTVSAGGQAQIATLADSVIEVPSSVPGIVPTPLPPRPITTVELLDALAQFQNQNFASSALSEPTAATGLPTSASYAGLRGRDAAVQIGNAAATSSLAATAESSAAEPIRAVFHPIGSSSAADSGKSSFSFGSFAGGGGISTNGNLFENFGNLAKMESDGKANFFGSTPGIAGQFRISGFEAQQFIMPYGEIVPITGGVLPFYAFDRLDLSPSPSH